MSREAIAAVILFPRDFVLTGRALDGWIDRCGKRAPTDRILKMVATLVFLSLSMARRKSKDRYRRINLSENCIILQNMLRPPTRARQDT